MTPTPARLTLALAVLAPVGAWLLLPGTAERLAMLARDGRFDEALTTGKRAAQAGTDDPQVLARLFDINSREGDPEQARESVLRYLDQRPDDVAMLWRAVEFMEAGDDLAGLKDVLHRLVERTRDPGATEKLARLYRLYGAFEEERTLLLGAAEEQLTPDMGWRAAGLLAREGESERAAALVRRLDDGRAHLGGERRILAFDILVQAGLAAEAAEHAARWTAQGLSASERSLFVLQLALAGADGEALALAQAPGVGRFDTTGLAWTLGTRGHTQLAEALIDRAMADAAPQTARRLTRLYVDLAMRTGSLERAIGRSHAWLREDGRRRDGTLLAAALFERGGYAAIAPLRPFLDAQTLLAAPFFAASLSLAERNALAARLFLERADLAFGDAADAQSWTTMALELLGAAETARLLDERRREGALADAFLPWLARSAGRTGRFEPSWPLFHSPSRTSREPEA